MKFLLPSFILLLGGCTTVSSIGPASLVENPEVAMATQASPEFFVRTEPTQEFEIVPDASARPLNPNPPSKLHSTGSLGLGLRTTVYPRLQLGLGASSSSGLNITPLKAFFKYQFLGSTYEQNPSPTHLAAIYGNLAYGRKGSSGDQKSTGGAGGYPWRGVGEFRGADIGISYGYRWSPRGLLYLGASHQSSSSRASVEQDASATGDFPAAKYETDWIGGTSSSLAAGVSLGLKSRLEVAYSYSHNKWMNHAENQHFVIIGLNFLPIEIPVLKVEPNSR